MHVSGATFESTILVENGRFMAFTQKDADDLAAAIGKFAQQLRMPELSLLAIPDDTDWTFLLKTHAVLEAASCEAIRRRVRQPAVHSVLLSLPFAQRVSILRDLGFVSEEQIRFIKRLSKLRHTAVHSIDNFDFTFANHLSSLSKQERITTIHDLTLVGRPGKLGELHSGFAAEARMIVFVSVIALAAEWLGRRSPRRHKSRLRHDPPTLELHRTVR